MTVRESIPLGPGPEFDLIRDMVGKGGELPNGVRLGPGDDCTVLDGGVVVSCDLSVEGVHFRRDWLSMEEAGYRAAAAALSDLAAMAAEPLGILLSMAIDPDEVELTASALQAGAEAVCVQEGIGILGGDLSRSLSSVVVDVVALGRIRDPLLRRGSLPGDDIWVTGWLGGSGGAVHLWNLGVEPPQALRKAFSHPAPRIREIRWLAEQAELHAGIDISDGLAGDAGHLSVASGVALILRATDLPLHPELDTSFPDRDHRLQLGLRGGEDYEVCFTAPQGQVDSLVSTFQGMFGIPLTRVGRVVEGEGVFLESADGEVVRLDGGFSHFSGKESR